MAANMAETLAHFPTLTILVEFDPGGVLTDGWSGSLNVGPGGDHLVTGDNDPMYESAFSWAKHQSIRSASDDER